MNFIIDRNEVFLYLKENFEITFGKLNFACLILWKGCYTKKNFLRL